MLLLLRQYLQECNAPPYPSVLHAEDSAYSFVLTERGMEKFIGCGLESAIVFASQMTIPNLDFDIDLGVTRIKLILSDINFANFNVEEVQVDVPDDNPMSGAALNANVELKLNWKFQQSSYPYINDQGTGQILLKGANLRVVVDILCDFIECPGHLKVDVHRASLDFEALSIILSGGSSWIYQSLIDLVINAVQDSICDIISKVLVNGMTDLMNQMLQSNGYYEEYAKYPDIIKDDRFAGDVVNKRGFMVVQLAGYIYKFDNLSDQFINSTLLPKKTFNRFNEEIQFELTRAGFNNFLYIFHKYHNVFSKPDSFEVISTPTIEFYNVQAVMNLQISKNGVQHDLQLVGLPQLRTDIIHNKTGSSTHNVTQIFFKFQTYTSDLQNDENEVVLEWVNAQIQHANYQIANTPFMDMNLMKFVFDPSQDVLRLVGSNPETCGKI
ncbi:Conserved_hypothetical protein [Hexamita inflata]|uniref:Lipid-binding serum glycoprotein N-terminal domain-containing protein n=1 Tax=Hexamita inflata TaxID=28002 RepID=A0ABP1HZF9_9EUKA